MRLTLRIAGILKFLFVVNILLIEQYQDYLSRNRKPGLLDLALSKFSLEGLEINFPFYFYFLICSWLAAYILNTIVAHSFAFAPNSGLSRYFYQPVQQKIILWAEILVLVLSLIIAVDKLDEAYQSTDNNVFSFYIGAVFGQDENAGLIPRLHAWNIVLAAATSILLLYGFKQLRTSLRDIREETTTHDEQNQPNQG